MKARDLMSSPALTVPPEASRQAVAALLVSHGIASAPVVGADGLLLGLVDETALVRDAHGSDAVALMTRWVVTVSPDDELPDLVVRMTDEGARTLVVVRDGEPVGIVSRRDVLRRVARGELDPDEEGRAHRTAEDVRPVVVGVDGSPASVGALRWAIVEAGRRNAPLHAVAASGRAGLDGAGAGLQRWARNVVSEAVQKALDGVSRPVVQQVRDGLAVPALREAGRGAQLLVVGRHGAGGAAGTRVGSVATHLAGQAPCPLVLVPDPSDDIP